ncbi:MAG: hypothetical protein QXK06_01995 [Candidatus Diapherotrites archaeon]
MDLKESALWFTGVVFALVIAVLFILIVTMTVSAIISLPECYELQDSVQMQACYARQEEVRAYQAIVIFIAGLATILLASKFLKAQPVIQMGFLLGGLLLFVFGALSFSVAVSEILGRIVLGVLLLCFFVFLAWKKAEPEQKKK